MTKQVSFLEFHTEGMDDSWVTKFAAVQKLIELLRDDWGPGWPWQSGGSSGFLDHFCLRLTASLGKPGLVIKT